MRRTYDESCIEGYWDMYAAHMELRCVKCDAHSRDFFMSLR